jgi:hypothetical protein
MGVDIRALQHSPIRPDMKTVRAVLAGVFNIDLGIDTVTEQHLIVAMAYKLLLDMEHDPDHLIYIFRLFRKPLDEWDCRSRCLISLNDNSVAVFIAEGKTPRVVNYRDGEVLARAPVPVFQVSVNLSALSGFLEQGLESLQRNLSEEAAAAADAPALRDATERTQ